MKRPASEVVGENLLAKQLSPLGFGCWQLGSKGEDDYWGLEYTQEMANDMLKAAVGKGIRFIDTAADYAKGDSETQLGVALKTLDPESRKKLTVASKLVPNQCGSILSALEGTLKRLQLDSIDLFQVHWPIDANSMAHFALGHASFGHGAQVAASEVPPSLAAFRTLAKLQRGGFIKHVGVCNFGVEQLKEAMSSGCKISSNQICYNLVWRCAELQGIIDFCLAESIALIAYSPLMQGLLTGRWKSAEQVPMYRARSRHFNTDRHAPTRHGEAGHEELLFKTLARLEEIAASHGLSMTTLAMAYPLHKGFTTVIGGFTKPAQLEINVGAVTTSLGAGLVKELDDATVELRDALGPNTDPWQGVISGKQTGRVK